MRIAMIGSGYVGLVSGACFSDFGHHVTCVDLDAKKIAALHVKACSCHIFEPGLKELVARNVREERLTFSTDLAASIADVEAGVHRGGHALAPRRRLKSYDYAAPSRRNSGLEIVVDCESDAALAR